MLKNTDHSYGLIARLLHWLMALIIIGLFAVGLYMTSLSYYDSLYHKLPWWHKSIGLATFALLLLRLVWKMINTAPLPHDAHTRIEQVAAALAHKLIYLLLFIILLSGYLISTAKGAGIEFFGLFEVPALIPPFKNQGDIAGEIHLITAYLLIALVAVHAAGAIKHHFIDKDDTLTRMTRG